ncbi:M14 family zinc carboxypeptidase [Peribacillus sp. B-H-3]|uniref:M14 family zinc carboxypeptidase n=1 Tax=Peribacillus sp. B-H-3 TaxID=3400420 RepID=UPI003B01F3D3
MKFFASIYLVFCLIFWPGSYAQAQIIQEDHIYTYEKMEKDLNDLQKKYKFGLKSLGITQKGKKIYAAHLGEGEESIIITGSHHGREWLTSLLLMKMLEQYAKAYHLNEPISRYPSEILNKVSIWFVPMVNPEGVSIQQGDLSLYNWKEKLALMKMNRYSLNFMRWKANGQGIDLNRQYPAGWSNVETGINHPSYHFYKGKYPLQAKEAAALASFTQKIRPLLAVAYHTSGREIYWKYQNKQENVIRDYLLASKTAKMTSYLLSVPEKHATGSGYTDWFITEFKRSAITLEAGPPAGETSVPMKVFKEEWQRNKYVGIMLAEEAYKQDKNKKKNPLHTKNNDK